MSRFLHLLEQLAQNDEEFEDKSVATQMWIRRLVRTEGIFESPIDLNVAKMKEIDLPLLEWVNFEVPPKKMKITNTGHTSKSN